MSESKKNKIERCSLNECNKKLNLVEMTCRFCGKKHCLRHCSIEAHQCKNTDSCKKEQQSRNMEELNSQKCNFVKIEKIS